MLQLVTICMILGAVVQKMDSAIIHWIVIFYPVLKLLLDAIKTKYTLVKLLVLPSTLKC